MGESSKGEQGKSFSVLEKSIDSLLSLENRSDSKDFDKKADPLKAEIIRGFENNEPITLTKENFSLVRRLLEVVNKNFGGCSLDFPFPLEKLTEVFEKVNRLFLNFLSERFPETTEVEQWSLQPEGDSVVFSCYTVLPSKEKEGIEKEFSISPELNIDVSEKVMPRTKE
ncbi:MAG: hypothetical protein V1716_05125 [Candidatus Uhrbacteria bacterium]